MVKKPMLEQVMIANFRPILSEILPTTIWAKNPPSTPQNIK